MTSSNKLPKFLQVAPENYKDWIWPKQRGLSWACCNCGLVHRVNFRVIKLIEILKGYKREIMPKEYQVEFQMINNDYMTNKIRKKEFKNTYLNESN